MTTTPREDGTTPDVQRISVGDLIQLEHELRQIIGDKATIEVNDGVLTLSAGYEQTGWTSGSDHARPTGYSWKQCELTNHEGQRAFTLNDTYLQGEGVPSVELAKNPNHPAYKVVAKVLREAVKTAKNEPVERTEIERGVRSKIAACLRPYVAPVRREKYGHH